MTDHPFPFRGSHLPKNSFWFRSGSDGADFTALRLKSDGSFDKEKANASNPGENEARVCYGMRVYALADGEVYSTWRNAPENPRPGEPHAGRSSDPKTIPRSGNHVGVVGDDGRTYLYAHFMPGTVPEELCPFNDEFVEDADNKVTPPGVPHGKAIVGAMVPADARPRVRKGQFLGRVGNSGASSGPHFHMHQRDPDGEKEIFTYDRAWRSDRSDPADWSKFTGQAVDASDKDTVIWASPLLRREDATAGGFGELAMHFVRSRRVVTALRDSSGNLKLITWGMTPPEKIMRRGEATAGQASRIAIAEPRSDIVVTALRDSAGKLRLISWRVETNGDITRLAHTVAGSVNRVALVTQKEGIVVTAVRLSNGNLKLIAWTVASNGTITRRGDANAGSIKDVTMTTTKSVNGVVTAVRTSSNQLKLIAWQVSNEGATITRRGDAEAGTVSDIAIVSRGNNGQFLLTAMRDGGGNLRLICWQVSGGGASIERLSTAVAGSITEVDIAGVANPSLSAVVACRTSNRLRLITWELSSNGSVITRWAGALAGKASKISIAGTSDSGRDFFVTACALSNGDLKLINWEANL